MRISDGVSDVCSSDLPHSPKGRGNAAFVRPRGGARWRLMSRVTFRFGGREVPAPCQHCSGVSQGGFSGPPAAIATSTGRSEEHTSELQSLMRRSYAGFCLKKKQTNKESYIEPD